MLAFKEITAENIREVFDCDPDAGIFRWKAQTATATKVGSRTGDAVARVGYRYISVFKKDYLVQRLVWLWVHGRWPTYRLTFLDNDRANCAIGNLVEYARMSKTKHDHQSKEGRALYQKEYRMPRRSKFQEDARFRTFGIAPDDYRKMLDAQGGVCAICARVEKERRNGSVKALAVDHDHETGAVRGLLCSSCNKSVGAMCDDPEILRAAASYIESHRPSKGIDPMDFYTGDLSSALCYGGG